MVDIGNGPAAEDGCGAGTICWEVLSVGGGLGGAVGIRRMYGRCLTNRRYNHNDHGDQGLEGEWKDGGRFGE